MPSIDALLQLIDEIAFVKPERYAREREYRFMFTLYDDRQPYQPTGAVGVPVGLISGLC